MYSNCVWLKPSKFEATDLAFSELKDLSSRGKFYLRRSCLRPDSGCWAWRQVYVRCFPVPESASLVVFEVLPAFVQHFYLCMNSFTKFLNTRQQMCPSVVCLVLYRIYEEKTAWGLTHNIHDTVHGLREGVRVAPLLMYFYTTGNVTWKHLQYGPLTAAHSFPRHIFCLRHHVYLVIHGTWDTLQFRLKMCLFPLSRSVSVQRITNLLSILMSAGDIQ